MMGDSVQALHYTRHGDRRTNIKPNYAAAWPDQRVRRRRVLNKSVACIARIV